MVNYSGLAIASDETVPHLGGSIAQGDPFTFSPRTWDYVITRFSVSSVLDVGSGNGNAAAYFHSRGLKTLAIEGLPASVKSSLFPALHHDLTTGPAIVTNVDLVHCQEVVEHIEERYLDHLLSTLTCGRIILMTHALPGQGGYHHVNLQPPEYWINHMATRGYSLLGEDTTRVRALAERDGAIYMQASGMIFCRF